MLDRLLYRGAPRRLAHRYRIVDGRRISERYAETDGAPVAVLVHGVGVSGRYLLPTAGRLARQVDGEPARLTGERTRARIGRRPHQHE